MIQQCRKHAAVNNARAIEVKRLQLKGCPHIAVAPFLKRCAEKFEEWTLAVVG